MKILVVDDEPLVRLALKKVFTQKGWAVEVAENGEEGLEKWQSFNPDLVFLDVLMPKLSGPEVLNRVPAKTAFVILMSAFAGDFDLDKAKANGADLFLAKPFDSIFSVVRLVEAHLLRSK